MENNQYYISKDYKVHQILQSIMTFEHAAWSINNLVNV